MPLDPAALSGHMLQRPRVRVVASPARAVPHVPCTHDPRLVERKPPEASGPAKCSVQPSCRRGTSRRFQRTGCSGVARRSSVPCSDANDPGDPRRLESSALRAGTSRPIRIDRGRNRKIPGFERTRRPGSRQTGQESATPASRFSLGERNTRATVGAASGLKEPRTVWADRAKRGDPQWALPAWFRSKVGGPPRRSLGNRFQ